MYFFISLLLYLSSFLIEKNDCVLLLQSKHFDCYCAGDLNLPRLLRSAVIREHF